MSAVHRAADIGYTFLPAHHGHGYATDARLGAHRVTGRNDARNNARNDASAAVLERLGMRLEAHLIENEWVKGEWTDESIYAVLAVEWASRPADPCCRTDP